MLVNVQYSATCSLFGTSSQLSLFDGQQMAFKAIYHVYHGCICLLAYDSIQPVRSERLVLEGLSIPGYVIELT